MVRYQSNPKFKEKNGYVLQTRSPILRTNTVTVLKPRIEPILKTDTITQTKQTTNLQTNETTKTKQSLKRKLVVYKKEDKFYIDNSAAYALKLTNVRAIMLDKPHLFEIGIETLYRLQSDDDIEIEYQEYTKDKEAKTNQYDLAEILEGLEQGEYGIGIHGVDKGSIEEKQSVADSISNEGLNINNNSKTILSTAISLGTNDDIQRINEEITGYKFGNGTKVNVILAVPSYIQNENGEKIFLGFPEQNKKTAAQQYEEHCILDRICSRMEKIPPQFVLGYYCENLDGSDSFIKNEQHYSNLALEERESLFTEISSNMDDVSKNYNDLINSGNLEQLSQNKERMQQLGLNPYMVDNAITLTQKYKEKTMSQNTSTRKTRQVALNTGDPNYIKPSQQSVKNGRRIILDTSPQAESSSNSTKSKKTRNILVGACNGTRLSDITHAKETLREGLELEEQEINYEGKEV